MNFALRGPRAFFQDVLALFQTFLPAAEQDGDDHLQNARTGEDGDFGREEPFYSVLVGTGGI